MLTSKKVTYVSRKHGLVFTGNSKRLGVNVTYLDDPNGNEAWYFTLEGPRFELREFRNSVRRALRALDRA